MKQIMVCLGLLFITTGVLAQEKLPKNDSEPWDYIMMKHGRMIEVMHNHEKAITKNVTLVNGSTIHPSGTIDVSSGKTKKLHEGEYITMDGRIRKLKDMVVPPSSNP